MNLGNGTSDSPHPSASVLMLRDSPRGLQIFLLKRNGASDVFGGVYVFPGGKLDPDDVDLSGQIDQASSALHAALAEPQLDSVDAAALFVAAIREVFEESGVLYADAELEVIDKARELYRAGTPFNTIVNSLSLRLQTVNMFPFSRWVTPKRSLRAKKHFDARFFVAAVPRAQNPAHDQYETTDSVWLSPAQALEEYWKGDIQLAAPQIMSLAQLAQHRDVASVLGRHRGLPPPCIQPEALEDGEANLVCYPGDPLHPILERRMPGPTRLYWRNGRYEPESGGLSAWLTPLT